MLVFALFSPFCLFFAKTRLTALPLSCMLRVCPDWGMQWGERTVIRSPHCLYCEVLWNMYCYILCADGYAEKAVQEAGLILSGHGLAPAFLGLKAGWIRGAAGGRVSAEVLISQVTGEEGERPLPDALLLAGGAECGQYLLADPRVHQLVQQMLMADRPVGWLRPIYYPLLDLLENRLMLCYAASGTQNKN